jgi:hypothetical protein
MAYGKKHKTKLNTLILYYAIIHITSWKPGFVEQFACNSVRRVRLLCETT